LIITKQGADINNHQAEQMTRIGGPNYHKKTSATVAKGGRNKQGEIRLTFGREHKSVLKGEGKGLIYTLG